MRIKGSLVLAGALAVAAVAWIASGQMGEKPATAAPPPTSAETTAAPAPTRVRVRDIESAPFIAAVVTSGQTEAARIVKIRAETAGRILETPAVKGTVVQSGDVLVQIDMADRAARLEEAMARIAQRQMEYDAATTLAAKGFHAKTNRAGAKAELEAARSERRTIEVDIDRTRLSAPVAGVLEDRMVEVGDYVGVGDSVATVVELNPLLITAQIAERQAPLLEVGMPAHARLSTGDELVGIVSYIASVADQDTRTFRIEIEIDNREYRYGQGLTAGIEIDLPSVRAHAVSPSIFRLDEQGRIGVMTVDGDNRARFRPVFIVGVDGEGTWVRGLSDNARVITVGHQLVDDGDRVEPVVATPEEPTS